MNTIETIPLGEDSAPFTAVRRNYELVTKAPRAGELVFKTLGEYAIHWPDGQLWQLLPGEQWDKPPHDSGVDWATADALRTQADNGVFPPQQMDLLEAALFREHRVATNANRLAIASKTELARVLEEHRIDPQQWGETGLDDLYRYVNDTGQPRRENVSLHNVAGKLWLSSAQTMLNVYHTTEGATYRLHETWKTPFDSQGNQGVPKLSTIRSSIGETGHAVNDVPERPYETARRGLHEELGHTADAITELIATGSLLRLKERGHHRFGPLPAQDHTHYFDAWLAPEAVRQTYINDERDDAGRLHTRILLSWALHEPATAQKQ